MVFLADPAHTTDEKAQPISQDQDSNSEGSAMEKIDLPAASYTVVRHQNQDLNAEGPTKAKWKLEIKSRKRKRHQAISSSPMAGKIGVGVSQDQEGKES